MTLWRVKQTGRVSSLLPQEIVNNEAYFPNVVERGPSSGGVPGPILSLRRAFLNFGSNEVAGVDAAVDYMWRTGLGDWMPKLALTYTGRYETQLTPDAPVTSQVSRASTNAWAPRWKGNASLGWKKGAWSALASGRYTSEYLDYQEWGRNTRRIGNFWLMDLSAAMQIGTALGQSSGLLSGTHVSVAVSNVFNKLPEWSWYSFSALGYDPTQYDIIGRMVQVNLAVRW
jgi:iron complex outermembrane receptor protein